MSVSDGIATLKDWLGDGLKPVSVDKAHYRSMSCLCGDSGNECPHHKSPRWWEHAKGLVADAIREQMKAKADLNIATPMEDSLKMCSVCGCCMSLKVWVPIEHVRNHTSKETLEKLPVYCWQRNEIMTNMKTVPFGIGNE